MNNVTEINPATAGAPKPEELRSWSIVYAAGRAFIGQAVEQTEGGMLLLSPAFSYQSSVAVNQQTKQIAISRYVTPLEFTTADEVACLPQALIPLEKLELGELEELARFVREAWTGREHIRKSASPLHLPR